MYCLLTILYVGPVTISAIEIILDYAKINYMIVRMVVLTCDTSYISCTCTAY